MNVGGVNKDYPIGYEETRVKMKRITIRDLSTRALPIDISSIF